MVRRGAIRRSAATFVLSLSAALGAFSISAAGEYLSDDTVFNRQTVSVAAKGIRVPFGKLGCEAVYTGSCLQ